MPTDEHAHDDLDAFKSWTDAELVAELERRPSDAPVWAFVWQQLAGPLPGFLTAIVRDGTFEEKAHNRHRTILLTPRQRTTLRSDRELLAGLVHDAVLSYMEYFEKRLRCRGGFDVDGGAKLVSYACTGGIQALVDRVRRWQRIEERETSCAPDEVPDRGRSDDPGEIVVEFDDAQRLLDRVTHCQPAVVRAVLMRMDTGESWAVIAAKVGMSRTTLERRLARLREVLRRDGVEEGLA